MMVTYLIAYFKVTYFVFCCDSKLKDETKNQKSYFEVRRLQGVQLDNKKLEIASAIHRFFFMAIACNVKFLSAWLSFQVLLEKLSERHDFSDCVLSVVLQFELCDKYKSSWTVH